MRILILGADGYLGWPTTMYLSNKGHEVAVLDSFLKRRWEMELGVEPLVPTIPLHRRVAIWEEITGKRVPLYVCDLLDPRRLYKVFEEFRPEAVVHYGEQPSAPYSMIGRRYAVETQVNNVAGTLNLLFAMKRYCPEAHLVKLGTMGEYGTPNIDIEEGFIEIEHKGRKDLLPFPKMAGSFYHLSKVHDSNNIMFACKVWGLRATDLNQGIVYGIETDETRLHPLLNTSFHYDSVFGTVLNRFCVQAAIGSALTVYGKGMQRRGFLNIRDTLQCVELSIRNPAGVGEFRVFNQFTEVFSVNDLADLVRDAGGKLGIHVEVRKLANPRVELDEHYYNPIHRKLNDLGLKPRLLSSILVDEMIRTAVSHKEKVNGNVIEPNVKWRQNG
ncbi:MAG: NAD-dependent epimerase/dehydratase family protein [Desulfobacteraceae bacterium]|nr:MAG: NAD-dependent epimerase/dehydratase family protein [Desulfobacteraceae bacterium]